MVENLHAPRNIMITSLTKWCSLRRKKQFVRNNAPSLRLLALQSVVSWANGSVHFRKTDCQRSSTLFSSFGVKGGCLKWWCKRTCCDDNLKLCWNLWLLYNSYLIKELWAVSNTSSNWKKQTFPYKISFQLAPRKYPWFVLSCPTHTFPIIHIQHLRLHELGTFGDPTFPYFWLYKA